MVMQPTDRGGDSAFAAEFMDLFNDCFSPPLSTCFPQPCNLQLLDPCSVIWAGDHSPTQPKVSGRCSWPLRPGAAGGFKVCTDHSFSLPMMSRFSTPGGFWPHTCPSQPSPPHPLAPSFSPCLRPCQFAPSLVSPVASIHTPTVIEHLHLPCGRFWFFRSLAHRTGCVSAAAGMWSDPQHHRAPWETAAAQSHMQHVQHPSLCSKAETSLQAP